MNNTDKTTVKNKIDISKRTKGEWYSLKINDGYAIKEKSLPKGFSDRIAELYEYNAEANAAFIVLACNNFDALIENITRLIDRMEENDLGQMFAVKKAKALLHSIEQQKDI